MLTLVVGGARSGKSALGERIVRATGRNPVYIASAEPWDDEMRARISRHRADRGNGWRTIEAPQDLVGALATVRAEDAVLIDCMTLWLSNLMMANVDPAQAADRLFAALADCLAPVVLVTNEVGQGIVPENALARRFRDEQGRLNQRLAAQAECAVAVIAGLPLVLKGSLPYGIAP